MEVEPRQEAASTTGDYFDRQASGWTERYNRGSHFRERLETVLEWIKDQPLGLRLLDYGCGSGVLLGPLVQMGHTLTGVDVSVGMLASARRTLQAAAVPAERFTLERLDEDFQGEYLKQTYDGIICLGVIEYLARPRDLLTRLVDRMEPGGVMILSFPNRSSILRKVERFVYQYPFLFRPWGIFQHLTASDSYLNFQRHQFAVGEIEQLLAERGLNLKRIRYHVAPRVLAAWRSHPSVAMTAIVEFRKSRS